MKRNSCYNLCIMIKNEKPLVSICTTFFNADKYIHRLIQSCLNQTYSNIEVVLVDENSIDQSEKIMEEYAKQDSRVKYFRIDKKIGIAECLKKAFEYAEGRYLIFPGADDWLTRDFIEKGVQNFEKYPDTAGVIPKIITLLDAGNNRFEYHSEINVPSGIYSREWFAERLYRSTIGVSSIMAIVRKEDALNFMEDFLKNYCYCQSFPESLREMYRRLFGTDMLFFLEILRRYKTFVWDNSLIFLKVMQSQHITFNALRQDSVEAILKYYHYHLICYAYAYKRGYPDFYHGMKIFLGCEALATAVVYFLKSGLKQPFIKISEDKKQLREFFGAFSIFEIAEVCVRLIPRIIRRFLNFAAQNLFKKKQPTMKLTGIFNKENFLDADGNFTAQ